MMEHSTYHSLLRIFALTFALLLIFDSGLFSPVTKTLSQNTQNYLAQAIGMYASIQPTELNQLTAKLSQRDRVLTERENNITAREIEINRQENKSSGFDYSTYIMSSILFIILVLIVINYAFDYIRAQERISKNTNEKMA